MATHQNDHQICYNSVGPYEGKVCDRCDGKCVSCDSMNNLVYGVKVCDICHSASKYDCILCGARNQAKNQSFYCYQCYMNEVHKDGCPRVTNTGINQLDKHYQKKEKERVAQKKEITN